MLVVAIIQCVTLIICRNYWTILVRIGIDKKMTIFQDTKINLIFCVLIIILDFIIIHIKFKNIIYNNNSGLTSQLIA